MTVSTTLLLLLEASFALVSVANAQSYAPTCRCTPKDACWPSTSTWNSLNTTLSGKLIKNVPVAVSCYPGKLQNAATCAIVDQQWTNSTFQSNAPVGLSYPIHVTCPPVDPVQGQVAGTCSIGESPVYTVDATKAEDVAKGIQFAKKYNIRLVVRNTGHDLLGRSTGYGSIQVWIRHIRQGLTFQKVYQPGGYCSKSTWKGSAITIGGGYTWSDVYPFAAKNNVVVVGGGNPSVGCIGGWMQGGGHSPANHDYGMGADQLLEAKVVLASGSIVTASPCENSDLFFAIRGGGGGTYGVVVNAVFKAHPTTSIVAQTLAIAPLTPNDMPAFMEAVAIMYAAYPNLLDAGLSGYGSWATSSPAPLFGNYTTALLHAVAAKSKTVAAVQAAFAPVAAQLAKYASALVVSVNYSTFPTYAAYYSTLSGRQDPVGSAAALTSRLLDRKALTGDPAKLRIMLNITAGRPEEVVFNNMVINGGGQVAKDRSDPYSGLLPGWRDSYVMNIVARGWAPGSDEATIAAVHKDITHVKGQSMKALAPNTGAYMNEGDWQNPEYKKDFYGANYAKLAGIKSKYDPDGLFFCPTCVGSDAWTEGQDGKLCRR